MFSFESLMSVFSMSASKAKPRMQTRLRLEGLEDRLVPAATNQEFVASAIQALDNRQFNAATDQQFVDQLNAGTQTPTQVALAIVNSTDGRAFSVKQEFNHLLLRNPTADETTMFSTQLATNTLQSVRESIMGSAEYFQFSGGTNDNFIRAVFADQLGRGVDPTGQAFFGGELANTALGTDQERRTLVAKQVVESPEGGLKETLVLFNKYLLREADIQGLSFFGSQLINSPLFGGQTTNEVNVIATLVGSQEFFDASEPTATT